MVSRRFITQYRKQLGVASEQLQLVTQNLLSITETRGPEHFLADATLYLEYFSIIAIAWQWLLQGIAVQRALGKGVPKKDTNFYQGKLAVMQYFFAYELPKTLGLATRLMQADGLTVDTQTELFND